MLSRLSFVDALLSFAMVATVGDLDIAGQVPHELQGSALLYRMAVLCSQQTRRDI